MTCTPRFPYHGPYAHVGQVWEVGEVDFKIHQESVHPSVHESTCSCNGLREGSLRFAKANQSDPCHPF